MNWILVGPILSFIWWMYFGLAGDWKPSKEMPHWIATRNRLRWLQSGILMVFLFVLITMLAG